MYYHLFSLFTSCNVNERQYNGGLHLYYVPRRTYKSEKERLCANLQKKELMMMTITITTTVLRYYRTDFVVLFFPHDGASMSVTVILTIRFNEYT